VTAANTAVNGAGAVLALSTIESYGRSGGNSKVPTKDEYIAAGVTAMTATILGAVNSSLLADSANAADTTAKVQAIVDAYVVVVANADGTADNYDTNLTQQEYKALGVTGVDNLAKLSLLGDVLDAKVFADVNSLSKLQALADAAGLVINAAAGAASPTVAQLESLGISGVTEANLQDVLTSIAASADDGSAVDTLAELQALITAVPPTVTITDDEAGTGNIAGGSITYTFTFSKAVTGFDAEDVIVTNGEKGTFTAVSANVYTLVVTPTAGFEGNVMVNVAKDVATDAAGNNNTAATESVQAVDMKAPTVAITDDQDGTGYIVGGPITYTFTFSEDVLDFDRLDIVLANEAGSSAVTGGDFAGSGSTYTLTVTPPTGKGNLTVDVNAGAATDVAGNSSTVAATNTQPYVPAVIDLDTLGKLIKPVQVEGKWYYFWDKNGDGSADSGDQQTHNALDLIFNENVSGVTGGNGVTTDVFRYATINGVKLALPTLGASFTGNKNMNGTAVSSPDQSNDTYNDLLAIWDAHNGNGTGVGGDGTPVGWYSEVGYWSATPADSGHASIGLSYGDVGAVDDAVLNYVALEVV